MTRGTQILADLLHEASKRRRLREEESETLRRLIERGVEPRELEDA